MEGKVQIENDPPKFIIRAGQRVVTLRVLTHPMTARGILRNLVKEGSLTEDEADEIYIRYLDWRKEVLNR